MRYARFLLVGYALLLLVGCSDTKPIVMNETEVRPTAVPTIPPNILTLYSDDGKVLGTWLGKDGTEFYGGQYSFYTAQGRMMVRGTYSVVPNH